MILLVVERAALDPIFTNQPYPVQALAPLWIRPGTSILTLQAIDSVTGMDIVYQLQFGRKLELRFFSFHNFTRQRQKEVKQF